MKTKYIKNIREKAEDHWEFIAGLLKSETGDGLTSLGTVKYLFIEAMIHGYKHREQEEKP